MEIETSPEIQDVPKVQDIRELFVLSRLLPRDPFSHKGSYGNVLLVAGSSSYRGAPVLAAEGALRIGAGIVTLASVEPVLSGVMARIPECCLLACGMDKTGSIDSSEAPRLAAKAAQSRAVLFGPGLGCTDAVRELLLSVVPEAGGAVVLDADGLNTAAAWMAEGHPIPRPRNGKPLILTPHPGEMARLSGSDPRCWAETRENEANRTEAALRFAREHDCILVLKGHHTLVVSPDGSLYRNTSGNAGLARGGSGDVLAGMITGLISACPALSPAEAVACAVWLHGAAADLASAQRGQYGMLPHDMFEHLGGWFARNSL